LKIKHLQKKVSAFFYALLEWLFSRIFHIFAP